MDVVGTTGWLAALAARPDGGRPLPAEEALALASTLARRLAEETAAGTRPSAALPPVLQAPEVLGGGAPGPVSDVYALTAGLWTMLAGRPPHVRDGEDDVPADVLAVRRAQPPDDVPDLPAPVTALLLRGLAVDPADRPQDAAALAEALDDCAGLVDYARRRELGQRYRPRPVTPRLAPDGVLPATAGSSAAAAAAAAADVPVGPVTPVDPLPVLGSRGRGRRLALLVAALAVVAGVVVLLVPGLRGPAPAPSTTPGPTSGFEVGPAGAVPSSGAATATGAGGAPPSGAAASSGPVPAPGSTGAGSPATQVPGSTGGVPGAPSVTAVPTTVPGSTSTSSPTPVVTSKTRTPVGPPTRPTVPPVTDTIQPPLPTA